MSELSYKLLVESVREYALLQTDASGIITTWNPGAERLFGYTSAEMVGQPAARLLTAADWSENVSQIEIERVMHGEAWQDERWLVRKDGSEFWAHSIAEPVRDESGRPRGIAKVLRDDTEKRHADQAIRASLAETKALLKDIHHRTKNNLQLLASLMNLQSNEVEDRRALSLLDDTRNRIFLIAAVHDIISRSGRHSTLDMTAYLGQLVPELVRLHDTSGRIQVRICGGSGPLELPAAVPLGLLLNELIGDACKRVVQAGRAGEITITAGREGDYHVLTLVISSFGMPSDAHYVQSAPFGLKLVEMLAQQLAGEVKVLSNHGLEFHVRFPSNCGRTTP